MIQQKFSLVWLWAHDMLLDQSITCIRWLWHAFSSAFLLLYLDQIVYSLALNKKKSVKFSFISGELNKWFLEFSRIKEIFLKQVLPDVTRDLESDCHNVTSVPHKETISVTHSQLGARDRGSFAWEIKNPDLGRWKEKSEGLVILDFPSPL